MRRSRKDFLQDIESFLEPKAPIWHANRGIPYRKGYLLYGPPGTGKSSLYLSLVGRFDLDVYILNISAADGHSLGAPFSRNSHLVVSSCWKMWTPPAQRNLSKAK